jgi:hypothetical protein
LIIQLTHLAVDGRYLQLEMFVERRRFLRLKSFRVSDCLAGVEVGQVGGGFRGGRGDSNREAFLVPLRRDDQTACESIRRHRRVFGGTYALDQFWRAEQISEGLHRGIPISQHFSDRRRIAMD